jgi:uncharacterized membrane protein
MAQQHTEGVTDTPPGDPLLPSRWRRGDDPEFSRLAAFTDGVYAIALTLLVLNIRVRDLRDEDSTAAMWSALSDLTPDLIAFCIAFVLLGRYWITHHDFYSSLGAIDRGLIGLNLTYLIFVAFLPFPTSLIGEYEGNPVALLVFALVLAAISGMETIMFVHAHRNGLLRSPVSSAVLRWGVLASLAPVAVFLVTMPFAFFSTTGVLLSWAVLMSLLGRVIGRIAPEEVRRADQPVVTALGGHMRSTRRQRVARKEAATADRDDETTR